MCRGEWAWGRRGGGVSLHPRGPAGTGGGCRSGDVFTPKNICLDLFVYEKCAINNFHEKKNEVCQNEVCQNEVCAFIRSCQSARGEQRVDERMNI